MRVQVKHYYTFVFHGAHEQDEQSLTSISCKVTAITAATSKSHPLVVAIGWLIHPLKYMFSPFLFLVSCNQLLPWCTLFVMYPQSAVCFLLFTH